MSRAVEQRSASPTLTRPTNVDTPHAAEINAASFNRVGNAPRVRRRGIVFRRTPRGALPTRLNESVLTTRLAHFCL